MTDRMTIPNAIIRLDDELTKLGKKVQDALRGIYDREDETKDRITALEAKVQAQQEKIEALRELQQGKPKTKIVPRCSECGADWPIGQHHTCQPGQEQRSAFAEHRWDDAVSAIKGQTTPEPEQEQPQEGYWECAKCKEELDPRSVTYEETHDGDCGGAAVWVEQEQQEWWSTARHSWHRLASTLNKTGTKPSDPDRLLAARARLTPEMWARGLVLLGKYEDDTDDGQWLISLEMSEYMRELLLGEGE